MAPAYGGTSTGYLLRRLARDRPDILARLEAGEFRSVRAAALEAGIAPRTLSIRVDDPRVTAASLRRHMSPRDVAELARLLTEPTPGT